MGERRSRRTTDESYRNVTSHRGEAFDTETFTCRLGEQCHKVAIQSADRLADDLLAQLPTVARSGPDEVGDLGDELVRAISAVLDGVFSADVDGDGVWAALGAHRARLGDDESDMLAVLDHIRNRSFDLVLDSARRIPASSSVAIEAVMALRPRLDAVTERARRQMLAGFAVESSHSLADEALPTATLVDRLLLGPPRSGVPSVTVADIGLEPGHPVALVAATFFPGVASRPLAEGVPDLARVLARGVAGPVRRWPQPHAVVLAPFPRTLRLAKATRVAEERGWTVVVIGPVDVVEIPTAYKHLIRDLFLLPVCTSVPGVVTADVLEHHRLMAAASVEEQTSFVHRVLSPVFTLPNWPDLLACVNALFETPSGIEGAARRMGIHHNTFRKYLKTVEAVTTLSTRVPAQAHRLFTAARLARPMMVPARDT